MFVLSISHPVLMEISRYTSVLISFIREIKILTWVTSCLQELLEILRPCRRLEHLHLPDARQLPYYPPIRRAGMEEPEWVQLNQSHLRAYIARAALAVCAAIPRIRTLKFKDSEVDLTNKAELQAAAD
jgi:hypothetical protein